MYIRLLMFALVCSHTLIGDVGAQHPPSTITIPDSVDTWLQREMQERRIPGLALAIVHRGEVLRERGYGLASVENDVPATPATRFALASLTKQFTATGIMMLIEDGRVELDAPISNYLTDAPAYWAGVTVRHLLTHTSGLPPMGREFSGATGRGGIYNRIRVSTAEAYAAALADTLHSAPGDRYAYSDVGYFLLGMITERVSGMPWRTFMQQRIFEPLGMHDTFILDPVGVHHDIARGYTLRNDTLIHLHRPWAFEQPSHFGIFSNVRDLVRWDVALYDDTLVGEASRRAMWTPVTLADGSTHPYGFGWEVLRADGRLILRHTGVTGTEIVRLPEDGVTVIVLTNLGQGFGGTARSWGLARAVAGMITNDARTR